jgi:phosphoglycerate dehydrogenase-like enzyme
MKILFAAREKVWGGFLQIMRNRFPQHEFVASGRFGFDSLEGFDVLIPTVTRVGRKELASADRLKLIQQCWAGIEDVDLEASAERNIKVANVPTDVSGNADSVAELGIYLMIGLSRNVREMARSMKDGRMGIPRGRSLAGKTVGIIGLGGIGRALVRRIQPFDVNLIGIRRHDPQKAREELGLQWAGTLYQMDELLSRSDYVVLCLPLTAESNNMIGMREFEKMKDDAYLINLARGGLVDREALLDALSTGKIAGAGLDVFWKEPPDPNDPIFKHNVLATPHIAGTTDISLKGTIEAVSENFRRLEAGEEILYVKN